MSVDLTGQRLGHYVVYEVIGRGGMSVVYRAVDERLERAVALKVMSENLSADPEFRARFTEEARAASAIDHVNVVPLYDFGEAGGWLFIAMRLVNGSDLSRELAKGPMPTRRVLTLLGQVGAALDMLHERGLVHLDVKPANVLITRNESIGNEHVYLADFGLTRRGPTGHRTASGDFLGSPTYASPEHLRGEEVTPLSDEYSLTCMLFTALGGRAPFIGDVRSVITGHLAGVVPSLSALTGLPSAIDRVIARGMSSDPKQRYASSADLLGAARRAIASVDDGADPPPVRPASPAQPVMTWQQPQATPGASWAQVTAWPPQPGAASPLQSGTASLPQSGAAPSRQSGTAPSHHPGAAGGPAQGSPPNPSTRQQAGPPPPGGGSFGMYGQSDPGRRTAQQGQVRPAQFGPDTTGRRPASHRIEPAKPLWPWWAGGGLVVVVAVVVVVLVTKGTGSRGAPVAPGTVQSSAPQSPATQSPVRQSNQANQSSRPQGAGPNSARPVPPATSSSAPSTSTANTLLRPTVLPTDLTSVSGLPNPFTSTG